MQRRSFLLQFGLHDLLGVVPRAAGIRHEDGLIEAEDRDGNQIADEEVRLNEGKGQRDEKDGKENVEHPFLRVLRADLDHFFAVGDGGLLDALEPDIRLDELDRAVGAGCHSLR